MPANKPAHTLVVIVLQGDTTDFGFFGIILGGMNTFSNTAAEEQDGRRYPVAPTSSQLVKHRIVDA